MKPPRESRRRRRDRHAPPGPGVPEPAPPGADPAGGGPGRERGDDPGTRVSPGEGAGEPLDQPGAGAAPGSGDGAPGDHGNGNGQGGRGVADTFGSGQEPLPEPGANLSREMLRNLRRAQKQQMAQRMTEARELARRAKELEREVKAEQRFAADAARHGDRVRRVATQLGFDPNRPITEVPAMDDPDLAQVEFQTIQDGRSYVSIRFDRRSNTYLYEVIEPKLTATEKEVLEFLRDTLVRTLDGRHGKTEPMAYLGDAIERAIVDYAILVDEVSKQRITYFLLRDFLGYGPIDVLMRDPMIEDISCDGPGIPIYLFHRQYESIKTNVVFPAEYDLDSFVIRLAQRSGKHISIAEPLLDATLPETSRLQATLSHEVTTQGSSFTIRKFRTDPLTPTDLVRLGTMNAEMAAFFWLAMEHGQSVIYGGGTASGKTTTLNGVCQFIPPQKKIVSIEDTREINLPHENKIAGLTRSGFGGEHNSKIGAIDMYKLLEAALRQRPEYLLVGEVRGPEALTLFQAMATGHATYSTLHADSAQSAVYRLENPPINVPRMMLQTLDCVAIQIQARVQARLCRRIKEVVEIVGVDDVSGDLLTNRVFEWDHRADQHRYLGQSTMLERIRDKNNMTAAQLEEEWRNRARVIAWMVQKGIRHFKAVAEVIAGYYSNRDAVLQRVAEDEAMERAKGHGVPAPRGLAPAAPLTTPATGQDAGAEGA